MYINRFIKFLNRSVSPYHIIRMSFIYLEYNFIICIKLLFWCIVSHSIWCINLLAKSDDISEPIALIIAYHCSYMLSLNFTYFCFKRMFNMSIVSTTYSVGRLVKLRSSYLFIISFKFYITLFKEERSYNFMI